MEKALSDYNVFTPPSWFLQSTEDEIMDALGKHLRKVLGSPVSYGYNETLDRYFFNADGYTSIDFLGKFLRHRRWDIVCRVVEVLETEVKRLIQEKE